MSEPRDDGAASPDRDRGLGSTARLLALGAGFLLAVTATLAVLLTEDPQYLRLAVIAVAWAFVLAAFAAGRRRGDDAAPAPGTAVARPEEERRADDPVRRESEEAMRAELAALRSDLAELAALRRDLSGLTDLRHEVGRLRAELSGEMLVERIVMRTQSVRVPGELHLDPVEDRTVEAPEGAGRLPEALPPSQPIPVTSWAPGPAEPAWSAGPYVDREPERAAPPRWTDTAPIAEDLPRAVARPAEEPAPAERRVADPHTEFIPRAGLTEAPPRPEPAPSWATASRHAAPEPEEPRPAPAYQPPPVPPVSRPESVRHSRHAVAEEAVAVAEDVPGSTRLERILAENDVPGTAGGRRRRRYREDDDSGDDVLARVLGRTGT